MMQRYIRTLNWSIVLCLFISSCKKTKDPLSSEKTITVFDLKASSNPGLITDVKGDISGDSIRLAVPSSVSVANLTPFISHTGQSISPASNTAQNFSSPVIYTVTASDKSVRKYAAIVRFLSSTKDILSFAFKATDNPGILTQDIHGVITGDTIKVIADALNLSSLVPSIIHNGKSISPLNGQSGSFVNPVNYTVTAEDGTTKKYTVVVSSSASLFVGNHDGNLYAIDAGTGKLKWKYPLTGAVYLSPTYADGVVFIGNGSYLYAINGATGQLKWKTFLSGGGASTSAQVVNNLIYIAVAGTFSGLIALNATTGAIVWQRPILADLIFCNPTVADGRVITSDFGWGLHCFNALTGVPLWDFQMGIVRDNAAIIGGKVFIGSEDFILICIDAATGLKKWAIPSYYDNNNHLIHGVGSSPTVHNGTLYTAGGSLRAYDTATGTLKWEYPVFNSGVTFPVGESGTIYGTSPGDLIFAVNSNGTLKWKYGNVGSIMPPVEIASATVANGTVFTGCGMNNKLIALNAANGQLLWSYEGSKPFTSGPCVVDGKNNVFHSSVSGAQQ